MFQAHKMHFISRIKLCEDLYISSIKNSTNKKDGGKTPQFHRFQSKNVNFSNQGVSTLYPDLFCTEMRFSGTALYCFDLPHFNMSPLWKFHLNLKSLKPFYLDVVFFYSKTRPTPELGSQKGLAMICGRKFTCHIPPL
jgi:hypothetical protein